MAYDPGALEAVLAAAVGADSSLLGELRGAFFESADERLSAIRAASGAEEWTAATGRLKRLAASFGALRVLDAAQIAATAPPGNVQAIARIERALAALRHEPV